MAASVVPATFNVDDPQVMASPTHADGRRSAPACAADYHHLKTVPARRSIAVRSARSICSNAKRLPAQDVQPRALQRGIVIIVEVIEADHRAALGEQPARDVEADEPRNSGDQCWLIQLRILEIDQRLKSLSGPLYLRCQGRRNT
jgi:hypothetical protein